MASVEGLQRRLKEYRPKVQSAFIVYVTPREPPNEAIENDPFEMVMVTDPDDPIIPKIAEKWQLKGAKEAIAAGRWRILVALKDGEPVGRIWESLESERRHFVGVPRVRLAKDEAFMFDLFVEREYRRSSIAMTMANYYFELYDPTTTQMKYVYGFISYENAPSILWHFANGFNVVQVINYLELGPRIKWKIPFSDNPRFGIMSRKGRHTDPEKELFGTSLMPNL